jgi:FkbM family methyltransferase
VKQATLVRDIVGGVLLLALATSTTYLAVTRTTAEDLARMKAETRAELVASDRCRPKYVSATLFKPIDFTVDFYGMKYSGSSENLIDHAILSHGAWEKYILYFLRDTMKSMRPTGGIFLDVGANTGQHSLFMSQYAERVHAIEPYAPVLKRFQDMIAANGIDNISVHPVGLGDAKGASTFYEPLESNQGTGSFVEGLQPRSEAATELEIVTGDSLFAGPPAIQIDLVKMDIEGYEKPALRGLQETLAASRPIVVMEITIDPGLEVAFHSERELRAAFPADYEFYYFDKLLRDERSGQYVLETFRFDMQTKRKEDLVAVPTERKSHVRLSTIRDARSG